MAEHSAASKAAWQAVEDAARSDQSDQNWRNRLYQKVMVFAGTLPLKSRPAASGASGRPAAQPGSSSAIIAPFGRQRGQPIGDLDDENLAWLLNAVTNSVNDPSKANYKQKNRELMLALQKEQAERLRPAKRDKR